MTIKKIEEKSYTDVYVAADGKEFADKDACAVYEKSFACAMKSYIRNLLIRETATEEDLFYTGSCETEVFVVVPKTEDDIIRIKQFAIGLGNSEDRVSKWIDTSDINKVILITVGYDNNWVYISRLENIVNNITNGTYRIRPINDNGKGL